MVDQHKTHHHKHSKEWAYNSSPYLIAFASDEAAHHLQTKSISLQDFTPWPVYLASQLTHRVSISNSSSSSSSDRLTFEEKRQVLAIRISSVSGSLDF